MGGSDGITLVKGSDKPAATSSLKQTLDASDLLTADQATLNDMTNMYFETEEGRKLSYSITGWQIFDDELTFYSARGDTIVIDKSAAKVYSTDDAGEPILLHTDSFDEERRRRHLLGEIGRSVCTASGAVRLNAVRPSLGRERNPR